MNHLNIGDTVQSSTQRAIVRWIGEIEDMVIIGLESMNLTLPGYTDGTCPFDNQRYFDCPHGRGYYVLESGFNKSYKIVQTKRDGRRDSHSDDEFHSPKPPLSASPADDSHFPQPIPSKSTPTTAQIQHYSDSSHGHSRGVLSRFTAERDSHKTSGSSPSKSKENSVDQTSTRQYQPDNYRSQNYERHSEPELTDDDSEDETAANNRPVRTVTTGNLYPSMEDVPTFGQEYFLDNWTLGRLKRLVANDISSDGQLCLNIAKDRSNIQSLIHEQINNCLTVLPASPPFDVCIELIRLFGHVQVIYPSRLISLYGNDYLLLAVLCSNNNCAYIRTSDGWAFTDEDGDHGQSMIVHEISQMIDDSNIDTQHQSEQCRHLLKDAAFFCYKLVV